MHAANPPQDSTARAQLEQRLNGLYQLLQHFENLQQQRHAAFQRHSHLYAAYKSRWGGGMYWIWTLIVTVVLSIVVLMIVVGATVASNGEPNFGVVALFLTPLPVALILAAVIVAARNGRLSAENAQIEAANQAAAQRIGELAAPEVGSIDQQLAAARTEYRNYYQDFFPEKYRNSVDVGACWHIVHDGRASTVQEAVNALVEDQRHQAVLDMHAAQIAEQQRATRVAQVNGVINASMQGAMIGTMVDQGNKTRAALNQPVTVKFKKY